MWKIFVCMLFLVPSSHVKALYRPVYFKEEEVRHVRAVAAEKPPCEENKLIELLAERQISSPESIIGIAIANFQDACAATTKTLKKTDDYLQNCTAPKSIYMNLLSGLRSFDEKLCKNNDYYKKYEKFDKCYTDLDKDYDACDGFPDWYETDDDTTCKMFKRIVDCYYIKTAKVCGMRAAMTLKELMNEVIACTLPVRCSVGGNPKIKDPMPEKYAETLDNQESGEAKNETHVIVPILMIIMSMVF